MERPRLFHDRLGDAHGELIGETDHKTVKVIGTGQAIRRSVVEKCSRFLRKIVFEWFNLKRELVIPPPDCPKSLGEIGSVVRPELFLSESAGANDPSTIFLKIRDLGRSEESGNLPFRKVFLEKSKHIFPNFLVIHLGFGRSTGWQKTRRRREAEKGTQVNE